MIINGCIADYSGFDVRTSLSLTTTKTVMTRTPRRRKKKWMVVKKFKKLYQSTIILPDPHIYRMGNIFIVHPATWATYLDLIENNPVASRVRQVRTGNGQVREGHKE